MLISVVKLFRIAGAGLPCADIIELIQSSTDLRIIDDDFFFGSDQRIYRVLQRIAYSIDGILRRGIHSCCRAQRFTHCRIAFFRILFCIHSLRVFDQTIHELCGRLCFIQQVQIRIQHMVV